MDVTLLDASDDFLFLCLLTLNDSLVIVDLGYRQAPGLALEAHVDHFDRLLRDFLEVMDGPEPHLLYCVVDFHTGLAEVAAADTLLFQEATNRLDRHLARRAGVKKGLQRIAAVDHVFVEGSRARVPGVFEPRFHPILGGVADGILVIRMGCRRRPPKEKRTMTITDLIRRVAGASRRSDWFGTCVCVSSNVFDALVRENPGLEVWHRSGSSASHDDRTLRLPEPHVEVWESSFSSDDYAVLSVQDIDLWSGPLPRSEHERIEFYAALKS